MEVPAKKKSLQSHQVAFSDSEGIQRRIYSSCLLFCTSEAPLLLCVRKEPVSFKDPQGALASQLFNPSVVFNPQ